MVQAMCKQSRGAKREDEMRIPHTGRQRVILNLPYPTVALRNNSLVVLEQGKYCYS